MSPGTGTACSRVRLGGDSGVISVRREKNDERSGRRGREFEEVDGSSLACSPLTFQFTEISSSKS
jgi:hypothetical protein